MGYNKDIYQEAKEELQKRRTRANTIQNERHNKLLATCPELKTIEEKISETGIEVSRAIIQGGNVKSAINQISKKNLELQQQREEILNQLGFPSDYLNPPYTCLKCKDKGFVNGHICSCHQKLLRDIACHHLSTISPLKLSTFDSFNLQYYPSEIDKYTGISPRQRMEEIYRYCVNYANHFSETSPSLFLYGATGLGKTHLSLAIAGKAIDSGYGVIYASAQNLLNKLQNEYFGRGEEPRGTTEQLLEECDLLIIDDLGSEFPNSFTISAIYNIINSRLLTGKPIIISTNLSLHDLEEKYSQRITSRIIGNYISLRFFGNDIRQIKRKEQNT